jgi:hypothetical protein
MTALNVLLILPVSGRSSRFVPKKTLGTSSKQRSRSSTDLRGRYRRGIDANSTDTLADRLIFSVHAVPELEVRPSIFVHGYSNGDSVSMATVRPDSAFKTAASLTPRFIRLRDAPLYLCDRNRYGHRLRAAGVSFEDRQSLLGHKTAHVTTHYSAADIGNLVAAWRGCVTSPPANLPHGRSCGRQEPRKCLRLLVEREGLEPSTPAL